MTPEWKAGEWYKTRGGHEAILHDVNFKGQGGLTLLGKVKLDSYEMACAWTKEGTWYIINASTEYDLMPPVERKELWVNVYNRHHGSNAWSSKELADKNADDDRVDLLRIVIEGDNCTAEKVTG